MSDPSTSRHLAFRVHEGVPWLVLAEGVLAELLLEPAWCALPGAAAGLRGATNVRGAVYPVFDLLPSLGYPPSSAPRLLLIESGRFGAAVAILGEPRIGQWQPLGAAHSDANAIPPFVLESGLLDEHPAWLIQHRPWFEALGGRSESRPMSATTSV